MSANRVHVAVGVIRRTVEQGRDEILISKRAAHLHQGGLWEFPGGKVEADESVQQALQRELSEELGIVIRLDSDALQPLIQIAHDYPDKQVLLDVWQLRDFTGEAAGQEGQLVRWVESQSLSDYAFPQANRPIIHACQLPDILAITPELEDLPAVMSYLAYLRRSGINTVVLRQTHWSEEAYRQLARAVLEQHADSSMNILLHGDPEALWPEFACGVHMPARIALQKAHALSAEHCLGMSCHNPAELAHAAHLDLTYASLSPVQSTLSHPQARPIGWERFSEWLKPSRVPVYALGGLRREDLATARQAGAQGIAGISGLGSPR